MIEFGSNKVRSIKEYFLKALLPLYSKDEAHAITYGIFEHLLGYKKHQVELYGEEPLNESTIVEFVHALRRLKKHEPLQYVTGKAWFRNLELNVNKSVLIPRPETEELVEAIINDTKSLQNPSFLDLCTGSGCIAIALSTEIMKSTVHALDISEDALGIAKKNAQLNNASVEFKHADILNSNDDLFNKAAFDVIVSNPPYIMRSEAVLMQKNVLYHEPSIALFVEDDDPLLFYRKILFHARNWLKPGGSLYFEINEQLGSSLVSLLTENGCHDAGIIKDISGKDRIVKARYQGYPQ